MFNGEALFTELERTYRLFDGGARSTVIPICFEAFLQAAACALAGKIVSAESKATIRREQLPKAGIDIAPLTNIDLADDALCAETAHAFLSGWIKAYGNAKRRIHCGAVHGGKSALPWRKGLKMGSK